MDEDGLRLQAANFCGSTLRHGLKLRRRPYVAAVRAYIRGAVLRFHRGMRQEGSFVHRLDLFSRARKRRRGVALPARLHAGLRGPLREELADTLAVDVCIRS